jgi:cation diffusion facilitator family transporter
VVVTDGLGTGAESAPESLTTVSIAFATNVGVAVAKTVAAVLTGSAGMVAEAAHSWADAGNQVLLFVADRRSRVSGTDRPIGSGREAYVWSLLAALGLFVAGGVVSVYHGISQLGGDGPAGDYLVGYLVLAVALVLEGSSLVQAFTRTRKEAGALGRDTLDHALATSDPTLRAVLAEDSVAVLGVLVAATGLLLHQLTGDGVYDAAASIVIGLVLCAVAVVLIDRNRRFLTGQVADPRIIEAAVDRLQALPTIARVTSLRLEFVGPHQLLLVAAVDLTGDDHESQVAVRLRRLEQELEQDPRIVDAVLTLAVPGEPSLRP